MERSKSQPVATYLNSVYRLAQRFVDTYFDGVEFYIIGDADVGLGPVCVDTERYFDIDTIVTALHNNIPYQVLMYRYDWKLENGMKKKKDQVVVPNLYNYWLQGKDNPV